MLASLPPSDLQTPNYAPYEPQHYFEHSLAPSSTSTIPYLDNTGFHTAQAYVNHNDRCMLQRQPYFDDLPTTKGFYRFQEASEGHTLMNDTRAQLQAPPVHVQSASPTPRSSSQYSSTPSSPRSSMLSETHVYQAPWLSPTGSMRSGGRDGSHQSPPEPYRQSHHRIPSDSSVGSAGPASPFDVVGSNPQIAQIESGLESSYWDSLSISGAEHATPTTLAKSLLATSPSFLAPAFQNYNPATQDSPSNLEARLAMIQALKEQQRARVDESPAPSLSTHTPDAATPKTAHGEDEYRSVIPTLNRTMSQIYGDELYNPSAFEQPMPEQRSQPAPVMNSHMLSPYRTVFSERIQAASNDHIRSRSRSPSDAPVREKSPFRPGYGSPPSPSRRFASAAQLREQQKAEADAEALRRAQSPRGGDTTTPRTISPKDAVLDYVPTEEDNKMPLFPPTEGNFHSLDALRSSYTPEFSPGSGSTMQPLGSFNFAPPLVPGSIPISQQYRVVPQPRRPVQHHQPDTAPDFPAHLTSMETSISDITGPASPPRPIRTAAESGTYTCTYHGCTLRFETPAKLQKHKREGHRQGTPASLHASPTSVDDGNAESESAAAALARNSQAGPHKCERINPSTGKPCNTIFSRPYDLTRHEDTIHNARKQKVRCQLCTEDKSFSRNDALTRHMRVVHPEVEYGGRRGRRA